MKNVLVLGAGMVSRPLVRDLLIRQGHRVTVADVDLARARSVIQGHPNGIAERLDASNKGLLGKLMEGTDIAVSMLPPRMHSLVAELSIDNGSHLVTASYAGNTKAFDQPARDKELIILNEMGLDPGIDHFSAMRIIEEVTANGGKITGFSSYCGGLPAPEANNALGYKFSWSPRGVFDAMRNSATFMRDGQVVTMPNEQLFSSPSQHPIEGVGLLEGYPNRDSLGYIKAYGLNAIQNMLRGTLRVAGWCAFWDKVAKTGILQEAPIDLNGQSYAGLTKELIGADPAENVTAAFARYLGVDPASIMIEQARELGLFEETPIPAGTKTPVDALSTIAQERMQFRAGERDMSVLQHTFLAAYNDRRKKITSTLIDFGVPGRDSSMSRLVGLTAAVGVQLVAENKVLGRGSLIPTTPDIYKPALAILGTLGVEMKETVEDVKS
ncbi:MAG: saccharopine dehydrogenase NADP-binding domain-containing protein [Candidatus Margulisbacteria bacterium]|nr:saccharopine dehydrogenase NADP-binding domain-containing protein [Candidatus Margulisiibacteriota bacterium]MBU1616951.1 saccharopine dehydrogenase NADP-binding domain-containing protein [Candidatus Margulisiibacteriota bacterium]